MVEAVVSQIGTGLVGMVVNFLHSLQYSFAEAVVDLCFALQNGWLG